MEWDTVTSDNHAEYREDEFFHPHHNLLTPAQLFRRSTYEHMYSIREKETRGMPPLGSGVTSRQSCAP